jgi:hypothetical protein
MQEKNLASMEPGFFAHLAIMRLDADLTPLDKTNASHYYIVILTKYYEVRTRRRLCVSDATPLRI